jgi:allantoicase
MAGRVSSLVVDTTHFKGNCPGWVSLDLSEDASTWVTVIDEAAVSPDQVNQIDLPQSGHGAFARVSIHPDGGLARIRVLGRPDADSAGRLRIEYLNALFHATADSFFATACASRRWIDVMRESRPFATIGSVFDRADEAFDGMGEHDWLEAFAAHPRIGERGDDEVANREQAGTASASRELIAELAKVNHDYEQKFGFTYIVYASGKTAEEMLAVARRRLSNERSGEIEAAAREQRRITTTRLRRMLCQEEV